MLLAIDTSSFVLSCALAEKDKLVAEWTVQKRLTHSEQLIPHMDEILKDAGVDQKEITAIAAAKGPGSFTGLRIGLATAKTAAYIWKVPLIGVDTLEALVWNLVGARAFILPLLDAQRGNVYAAMYCSFAEGIQVAPPHNCCARASSVAMAAFVRWEKGQIDDPLQLMPNYIRRSEAEVLWEKLHGMN